jgi:hypothetical protein
MDKELDTLLESGLLSVPDDFVDRVMREVRVAPFPAARQRWREKLQWLALLGGATLGTFELLAFIFGMWAATTAS